MIPDYQSLMLPFLKIVADGQEHQYRDVIEKLAQVFQLTDEDRKQPLSSGQSVFYNRVGWARTYLKKAGLIDSPQRARFVVTERGINLLKQNPEKIDIELLQQFSEFVAFQNPTQAQVDKSIVTKAQVNKKGDIATPEDQIDNAYTQVRQSLAAELLNKAMELSPAFFEQLVVDLLVKMGYGGSVQEAGKAIGRSGDGGIDGIIKEDKLGLDAIYIQAKRWQQDTTIGRPEIQKFVGALAGQGAKKGVFITTARFTKEAQEYTPRNETKIVLIDGAQLAQLMIDYNIGCSTHQTYELKRLDGEYFGEE